MPIDQSGIILDPNQPRMDFDQAARLSAMGHLGASGLTQDPSMAGGPGPAEEFVAPKLNPLQILQRALMGGESPEVVRQKYLQATTGGRVDKGSADYLMKNVNARPQPQAPPGLEFGSERGGLRAPAKAAKAAKPASGASSAAGTARVAGIPATKEQEAATFEKRRRLLEGLLQEDKRQAVMERYNELATTGRIDPEAERRRRSLLLGKSLASAVASGAAAGGFRGGAVAQNAIDRGWQGAEAEFRRPWDLSQEQMDADYKHLSRDRNYANVLKNTTEDEWVDPATGEVSQFPELAQKEASIAWMKENAPALYSEYMRGVRGTELANLAREEQIQNARHSRTKGPASATSRAGIKPADRERMISREADAIQKANKGMSRAEARRRAAEMLGGRSGRFDGEPSAELPAFAVHDNRQQSK